MSKQLIFPVINFIIAGCAFSLLLLVIRRIRMLQMLQGQAIAFLQERDDIRIRRKYFPPGSDRLAIFEEMQRKYPGYNLLGWTLFIHHSHAELHDPEEIVYTESFIVELLETLGHIINISK